MYGQDYSLDDLYGIALEKSEKIKIAEEDLYISERDKERATAALIPTFSAFGTHTKYSEEKGSEILLQPDHANTWGLRIDQSLSLSGREITAYRVAKEEIRKSGFELQVVREQYLLDVAAAYYNVLKMKKTLAIANANVDRLTKYRDASKTRLRVGEATKTVLLRAEAELAGSQSDKIKVKNNLRFAKTTLARIAGIAGEYDLTDPLDGKDIVSLSEDTNGELTVANCDISDLNCLKQAALAERAELKAMKVQKAVAIDNVKYAKGSFWPDLSIEGVYFRQENDPELPIELDESIYAALKFNFPFYEGGLRRAEVRQAKARQRQTEYGFADLERSVEIEVERAYLELMTFSAILDSLNTEKEYAIDNFNAVKKQFQHGIADSIDVIDANTLLVNAELGVSNAGYDYRISLLRLRRATGIFLKTVRTQINNNDDDQ